MNKLSSPVPLKKLMDASRANAYSGLIWATTRLQGASRPLPPEAEYAKPPSTDNPLYNDSHYFNFFDHQKQFGGFTRIGKLGNQNASVGLFALYDSNRQTLLFAQSEHIARDLTDIRSSTIRYEILEPLKKLRIVAQGKFLTLPDPGELSDPKSLCRRLTEENFVDVEAELLFHGWGEVHNSKKLYARGLGRRMVEKGFGLRDLAEARKFASEHYEQVGSYEGVIRIGSREIVLNDATGHRDHSWGPRDMSAIEAWTWLTVQFGPDVAVNLACFKAGRLDIFGGTTCRNGRNYPLRRQELQTEFRDDGLTQKSLRFSVEDIGGFRMEVEGHVLNSLPLVVFDDGTTRTLAFEAMTEYRWQGRTACGISEYVHRIRKG